MLKKIITLSLMVMLLSSNAINAIHTNESPNTYEHVIGS